MIARLMLAVLLAMLVGQSRTTLDIYVIDVEGGNATLFVTPSGESVLIDTGNANGAVRDAAASWMPSRMRGLTQIDHLILTHYHGDHFGGMAELAKQIPDQGIHRSRAERAARRGGRSGSRTSTRVYTNGEAHGGETRRSHPAERRRLADRGVGGRGAQIAACPARASPIPIARISSRPTTMRKTRCRWASYITFGNSGRCISAI